MPGYKASFPVEFQDWSRHVWWTCTVLTIGLALLLLLLLLIGLRRYGPMAMTRGSLFCMEPFQTDAAMTASTPSSSTTKTHHTAISTPTTILSSPSTSTAVVSQPSTSTAIVSTPSTSTTILSTEANMPVETITTTPVLTAATLTNGPLQPMTTTVPTVISIAQPFLATQNPWLQQDVTPVVVSGTTPSGTAVSVNVVPSQTLSS